MEIIKALIKISCIFLVACYLYARWKKGRTTTPPDKNPESIQPKSPDTRTIEFHSDDIAPVEAVTPEISFEDSQTETETEPEEAQPEAEPEEVQPEEEPEEAEPEETQPEAEAEVPVSDPTPEEEYSEEEDDDSYKPREVQNSQLVAQLHKILEQDMIFLRPEIRIDDVAHILLTNRTYISRLMRQEYGLTFTEYVNIARIQHSQSLLYSTEMTLDEISEKSGFQSTSNYCRTFKRHIGMSPQIWKQKVK